MSKNILFKSVLLPAVIGAATGLSGCAGAAASAGRTAVEQGNSVQLRQILDQPNHGNENLNRLLDGSLVTNCAECARLLFQAGAQVQAGRFAEVLADEKTLIFMTDLNGRLALAAVQGHAQIAQLLIDHGAEPSAAMSVIRGTHYRSEAYGTAVVQAADAFFNKIAQDRASKPVAPVSDAPTGAGAQSNPAPAGSTPGGAAPWWK